MIALVRSNRNTDVSVSGMERRLFEMKKRMRGNISMTIVRELVLLEVIAIFLHVFLARASSRKKKQ